MINFRRLPVFAMLIWGSLFLPGAAAGQSCNESVAATTPSFSFTINGDGTVTDKSTGLMWMRCNLGQVWDGKSCKRDPAVYDWKGALQAADDFTYAGYSDWRLPNKNELASLVETRCFSPAINLKLFPSTPGAFFWSSSPFAGSSSGVWSVDFGFGVVNASVKGGQLNVRLVRAPKGS